MSALRHYKPNNKDRSVLRAFLERQPGISKPLAEILTSVIEGNEPLFYFLGAAEFSTQEAADILNVSRPFIINLLNEGKIVFRKVGKHRRINAASLMEYKAQLEDENKRILDELTAIAQKENLGY